MKTKMISILGLFFSVSAFAHLPLAVEVKVIDPTHRFLKILAANPDLVIDHVSRLGYEVYGPTGLKEYLTQVSIPYSEPLKPIRSPGADYPAPETVIKKMQDLEKKYPTLVQLIEIGKSVEGRPLMFAKLTAPANAGSAIDKRPEFKYIANMHGDEIVGRELMMKLIEDLASHYGKDNRVTTLLNTVQVYILPSMNPDGAAHQTRYNAKGTDLNRSFPDFMSDDNQNTMDGREPEIQAVMKFQAAHQFKLSANFHGGAQVVNYPWDAQPAAFPLENFVKKISLDYAKKVPYIYASTEFPQGITDGFAWYQVLGGMQDWSYHWYNDIQVTIELTNTKWPAFSSVSKTYDANRDALLTFIEDVAETP